MANFVSKPSVGWIPCKERAVLPDAPAGKEIYEGDDRDAINIMKESGITFDEKGKPSEFLGGNVTLSPDLFETARKLGYKDVNEYLTMRGVDLKKQDALADEKLKVVVTHKNPERKPASRFASGGDDTSGQGRSMSGGFGDYAEKIK